MRDLPVQLAPMGPDRRGVNLGDILRFLLAFAAMFGGALLALEVLI